MKKRSISWFGFSLGRRGSPWFLTSLLVLAAVARNSCSLKVSLLNSFVADWVGWGDKIGFLLGFPRWQTSSSRSLFLGVGAGEVGDKLPLLTKVWTEEGAGREGILLHFT